MYKNIPDSVKLYFASKKILDEGFNNYSFKCKDGEVFIFIDENKELFILEDQIDEILKEKEELMREVPYVVGENRVAILVESHFFANNSGIYTFIIHLIKLFKDLGINADIITDLITGKIITDLKHDNVTVFLTNIQDYDEDRKFMLTVGEDSNIKLIKDLKEYLHTHNPKCIFSNGFNSTNLLVKNLDYIRDKNIQFFTYTHIGDILALDLSESFLDFTKQEVIDHVKLLRENNIPVATQTEGLKEQVKTILPDNRIDVLPEPFYSTGKRYTYTTEDESYGVLAISSLSPRKNIDLLLEIIGVTGLPLTLSTKVKDKAQEKEIYDKAANYGVQKFIILNNVPNEYISCVIRRHRCLVHLSVIEMLPYSILEALPHIPCIINGNANWSKNFKFKEAIKVNPDNLGETVSTILKTYGDHYLVPKIDENDYIKESLAAWGEYLL